MCNNDNCSVMARARSLFENNWTDTWTIRLDSLSEFELRTNIIETLWNKDKSIIRKYYISLTHWIWNVYFLSILVFITTLNNVVQKILWMLLYIEYQEVFSEVDKQASQETRILPSKIRFLLRMFDGGAQQSVQDNLKDYYHYIKVWFNNLYIL